MRLIDERDLIRRISELPDLRTMNTATIGKIIKACPTVEAEPVRHGRWIFDDGVEYCYKCSECKAVTPPHYIAHDYCPHCGAKMDGKMLQPLTWEEAMQDDFYLERVGDEYVDVALNQMAVGTEGESVDGYIFYTTHSEDGLKLWAKDYGKTWRCWSRRPTPEERAAIPWEEID